MSKTNSDITLVLKYIGYCLANLPPSEATPNLVDYVNHAKFVLSHKRNILLKDPIWDRYTDEEILAEYYAIYYFEDEDGSRKRALESLLNIGNLSDDLKWIDEMTSKNDTINMLDGIGVSSKVQE